MAAALRGGSPGLTLSASARDALIEVFETHSRGRERTAFPGLRPGQRRVLVSGFDPFGFQGAGRDLRQGNPSGAAVLALDGATIRGGRGGPGARVHGTIFPVRYADFDAGQVERTFRPFLLGPERVDLLVTISQGRLPAGAGSRPDGDLAAFELERWAGRRRATREQPDNLGRRVAGAPVAPPGLPTGPEFLESRLPRRLVLADVARAETPGEREFCELRRGDREPTTRSSGRPRADAIAVRGSGGAFLSNEIFYRTLLLIRRERSEVPAGHLHVPRIAPPDGTPASEARHTRQRNEIVAGVFRLLRLALRHV
jgi:pyrrolidone-carboxylate peptidase